MNGNDTVFLVTWVVSTGLVLAGAAGFVIWAIRNRQFSNQDRARYLPLASGIPEDRSATETASPRNGGKPAGRQAGDVQS